MQLAPKSGRFVRQEWLSLKDKFPNLLPENQISTLVLENQDSDFFDELDKLEDYDCSVLDSTTNL